MHFIHYIQCFKEFFQKTRLFLSKILFFQNFSWSNLFFDQSKLHLKFLWASVCFDQSKLILDQSKNVDKFFLKSDLTYLNHFFKTFSNSFFSLQFGRAPSSIFYHFWPNFLQSFPLPRPVCPLHPFFFIYFQFYMHFFMHWRVIFGLCINWGFWCFKPYFVKLINGFCGYIVIFMIYVG